MEWIFMSDSAESISLHDCGISGLVLGDDIEILFKDGFDVFADNPQNDTGRHKHTGKAEIVLKNATFVSGELYNDKDGTRKLTKDDLLELELDVLNFKCLPDSVIFACDAFKSGRDAGFCELVLSCSDVIYYWNEFTEDAWFQE